MAAPAILLKEYGTDKIGGWVPGEATQSYEQLQSLRYKLFSKDQSTWSLHFHPNDGPCEGQFIGFLWDSQSYFNSSFVTDNKMKIFAHFEKTTHVVEGGDTVRVVDEPLEKDQKPGGGQDSPIYIKSLPSEMSDSESDEDDGPVSHKRSKRQRLRRWLDTSDSESEAEDPSDSTYRPRASSPERPLKRQRMRNSRTPVRSELPITYTSLDQSATPTLAEWSNAREEIRRLGLPKDSEFYKSNWNRLSRKEKSSRTHVFLMSGPYGIASHEPCPFCQREGKTCRIYHPAMYTDEVSDELLGSQCALCRLYDKRGCESAQDVTFSTGSLENAKTRRAYLEPEQSGTGDTVVDSKEVL